MTAWYGAWFADEYYGPQWWGDAGGAPPAVDAFMPNRLWLGIRIGI